MSGSPSSPLIGNAAARAVHGWSAGADCVLLGTPPDDVLPATLTEICGSTAVTAPGGHPGQLLRRLADLALATPTPLVLADAGLRISAPALLDLLDSPGDATAALLADPRNIEAPRQPEQALDRVAPARLTPDGSSLESVGTSRHTVTDPNRVSVGVLRIAAADRLLAAELWRAAAGAVDARPEAYAGTEPYDLALLALVRGGLRIGARTIGYYDWSRHGSGQAGLGASPWRQRLRSASRLGDGAYSAAVVRPLSRIGTRLGLAAGLTPNVVTAISLAVGIAAGLLILTGHWWAWVLAAVLLQLALVIDCMDGEIARFTRRFSAFGAWLDGIGDRVKEYLVLGAVAAVAVREGHPAGWLLAAVAMVVVTARHLEDYSYTDRTHAVRAAHDADRLTTVQIRPLDLPDDGGAGITAGGAAAPRTTLPAVPGRRRRIVFWAKKIAHVPIAERYLVLSVMLIIGRPVWLLVAAIAVSGFALVWTVGGRLLRALRAITPPPSGTLAGQLDLGVLSRLAGRRRIPFLPATPALVAGWLITIIGICTDLWPVSLAGALISAVLIGSGWKPPIRHRFAWLTLPLVWVAEAAVVAAVLSRGELGLEVFIALAAIAYRRYELIYSLRLAGGPGPAPVLGAEGRILAVAVLVTITDLAGGASGGATGVLGFGLLLIAAATLVEAVVGTASRWRHGSGKDEARTAAAVSPGSTRSEQ